MPSYLSLINRLANKEIATESLNSLPSWLQYISQTKQKNVNLEHVHVLAKLSKNPVLDYVHRTLIELEEAKSTTPTHIYQLVEETLAWSEVAKCGSASQRKKWLQTGYNIHIHNIGSAQLFREHHPAIDNDDLLVVQTLISTHGLIGQYRRGEVNLIESKPLFELLTANLISKCDLSMTLRLLNRCIISAISHSLWNKLEQDIYIAIDQILNGQFDEDDSYSLSIRLKKLRQRSILNGENFEQSYLLIEHNPLIKEQLTSKLKRCSMWYVEPALQDFSFTEFIKIILLATRSVEHRTDYHLDFSLLMQQLYYDHQGKKKVNLFKKRIFEKYLSTYSFEDILNNTSHHSIHVKAHTKQLKHHSDTYFFSFAFSKVTEKLIDFCIEAEKAEQHFEKAILLLYDYFDLRRDQFDRFHNEQAYLESMNANIDSKKVILNYIVGQRIIDIGPGGGALLDEILLHYPTSTAIGIDFSKNVVDALQKRKTSEKLNWEVLYGNALDLEHYVKQPVDTIIFCSIIHELYSYINWEGHLFNHDVIRKALQSAFAVLNLGGRIIIRDGIMTEPRDTKRIIRFNSAEGIAFVKRYADDFKGRKIVYDIIGRNEVLMPINDAMEMLYTYTWGEDAYIHEVQEQFGYFTPSEYRSFIKDVLGDAAHIIKCQHYLQEGYSIALSPKIEFMNEAYESVPLPDSTSLIIIEKIK